MTIAQYTLFYHLAESFDRCFAHHKINLPKRILDKFVALVMDGVRFFFLKPIDNSIPFTCAALNHRKKVY